METRKRKIMKAKSTIQGKHVLLLVFGFAALFVLLTRERTLLEAQSFLRRRYAAIPWLMFAHGIPGALALCLGVFQFSNRLRRKYLQVHRVMGRIYVGSVAISAPVAVAVAIVRPIPTLAMASLIQALGWVLTTATGLYCIRTGKIQQHREWMMRSYPFAMVFIIVRAIVPIPAIARMGELGIATVVWSVIATACFLPSFVIAWEQLAASRPAPRAAAPAAADRKMTHGQGGKQMMRCVKCGCSRTSVDILPTVRIIPRSLTHSFCF
jgi:uncharacterized membrane protein